VNESPAHATRLKLLGTVHGDPRGFRRLHLFLEIHQPDLILIELSPFGWAFRKVNQAGLNRTLTDHLRAAAKAAGYTWNRALAHPEIRAIRRQIALPFEYRASRRYAQAHDKRILLVDRSDFSQALVATWPDLLSTSNLALLLTVPPSRHRHAVEEQYRRAHTLLHTPSGRVERFRSTTECSQEVVWQERERSLAERVREAILAVVPPSCVYVGGWEHLSSRDNPKSLRRLLGMPAATCHLLDDFDPRAITGQQTA
jgi:pheromone shutdown protein TraB